MNNQKEELSILNLKLKVKPGIDICPGQNHFNKAKKQFSKVTR